MHFLWQEPSVLNKNVIKFYYQPQLQAIFIYLNNIGMGNRNTAEEKY